MSKSITVVIDRLGNPKIEANGFNGMGCEAATAPIENALKGKGEPVTRELKGEYYQMDEASEGVHQNW